MTAPRAQEESIFAPITAPGRAPVSVIRLSGFAVLDVLARLSPKAEQIAGSPRSSIFAPLLLASGEVLDHAVFTFYPAPRSYTGENCLEISVHGSPYILKTLIALLQEYGVRLARAGEFSERAFLNGKLDLSQTEAVADLISSETEVQARVAREQLEGKLSQAISNLGEPLRDLLSQIEAYIDFPDEDIEPLTQEGWLRELRSIERKLTEYCDSFGRGRLCREGALVVLAGLPNAGKSSALNRLLGEDRAIVTAVPGTTRDSIEELTSINGFAVRLCDTAGLLDEGAQRTPDEVEMLGIERSWKKLESAELVLFIVDASIPFEAQFAAGGVFEKIRSRAHAVHVVMNKMDQAERAQVLSRLLGSFSEELAPCTLVSAATGDGFELLRDKLAEQLFAGETTSGSLLITNERHHRSLMVTAKELKKTISEIEAGQPPEIIAFHVRSALSALSDIIGVTYTDDILGRIFSKFCIGK